MLAEEVLMYPSLVFPVPEDSPGCPYRGMSALTVPCGTSPYEALQQWAAANSRPPTSALHYPQVATPYPFAVREAAKHCPKEEPELPKDPRLWSREDVSRWVQHLSNLHRLPGVHLDRFLMNGKALCLMSMEMFVRRVPLGGKLLYKDFQLRLSSALYG